MKSRVHKSLMALCAALAAGFSVTVRAQETGRKALLEGVNAIAAPGLPGTVCAFGPEAFPVVVGSVNRRIVGAVEAAGKSSPAASSISPASATVRCAASTCR